MLKTLLLLLFIISGLFVFIGWVLYEDSKPSASSKALNNARNVALALKTYANEHNGEFPVGNTAAEVFSQLLPQKAGSNGYISDKRQFYVNGSQYTPGDFSAFNSLRAV